MTHEQGKMVAFTCNGERKTGLVTTEDYDGKTKTSCDIYVREENMLYKHVPVPNISDI